MLNLVSLYMFVFAALTVAGGVIGFVKAKSKASIIAGTVAGALLVASAVLIRSGSSTAGLVIGLVASVALAGRFTPAFLKTRAFMPAGVMALASAVGIALAVGGFVSP
jgi:uncharacterized membrane protein (UPF0136 family)